jgi:hypothetical protein
MKNNNQLAMGSCDKEGKGNKGMVMAIRVAGNEEGNGDKGGNSIGNMGGVGQRGQWLWQQEQWR